MSVYKPNNISPKRILVITRRYLGDTLLITPLLSSLKQAYTNTEIDVLLTSSNIQMLEGNPDVSRLITLSSKPSLLEFGNLLFRLFRQYDLAISTQTSDHPTLCAIVAGKTSIGFVPNDARRARWKKWLLSQWLIFNANEDHAILENLRFCELLNINRQFALTPPRNTTPILTPPPHPYVVLHIMPQWHYKQWHNRGWQEIIEKLHLQGYHIVLTGSSQADEKQALQKLQQQISTPIIDLSGQLTLGQLTNLIKHAALFIGPDTGITHLAAATGTPTLALFGPTDPATWGPWPKNYVMTLSPFKAKGTQQVGNVYLIQGVSEKSCIPCRQEGCMRNRNSPSECLDNLSSDNVMAIVNKALNSSHAN